LKTFNPPHSSGQNHNPLLTPNALAPNTGEPMMQNLEMQMQYGLSRLELLRQEASLMRQLKSLAPRPMKQPRPLAQLKPQNA
jgi:hypothetical protein